jgi:hypothetical protein
MSTGADQSKQARTQDSSGGNVVGKGGTPDNQSTSRPKGST